MKEQDYSILIGGAAGEGSRAAGLIIAKIFKKQGYNIFVYNAYASLITGGHNFSSIRAAKKPVSIHRREIDFLLALDEETIKEHKKDLGKKGLLIYNQDAMPQGRGIGVRIESIAKKMGGKPVMKNIALVAAFAKTAGVDWDILEDTLKEEFKEKADLNLKIAKEAYSNIESVLRVEKLPKNPARLMEGNEAVAMGAAAAGLEFYIGYPMCPATGILHFFAKHKEGLKIPVFQPENEISVITAALGASYAGKRTMIGTSGGGFALMTEALSLAGQSETPLVLVESQRLGPATGVPTYTAQGDLLFAIFAGHGDFQRLVVLPGDAEQSFSLAGFALNIAWKYQIPAIVLIEKDISDGLFTFNEKLVEKVSPGKTFFWKGGSGYSRYKITKNGISPLAFPGAEGAVVKVTSYEHDEFGLTVEDEESIRRMQDKRLRKEVVLREEVEKTEAIKIYGKRNSSKAVVAWGLTVGPAVEAAEELGIKVIQPLIIHPFPEKQFKAALKGVNFLISAETNASGQMAKYLTMNGIEVDRKILKYTGRPFTPEELKEKIKWI